MTVGPTTPTRSDGATTGAASPRRCSPRTPPTPPTAQPLVSIAQAPPDGTHTDWSKPISLPEVGGTPQGSTYLLPHLTPDGALYTSLITTMPKKGYCCDVLFLDKSNDGGLSW